MLHFFHIAHQLGDFFFLTDKEYSVIFSSTGCRTLKIGGGKMYDLPIGYIENSMLGLGDRLIIASDQNETLEIETTEKSYNHNDNFWGKKALLKDRQTGTQRNITTKWSLYVGCCFDNMIAHNQLDRHYSSHVAHMRFVGMSDIFALDAWPENAEFVEEIDLALLNQGDRIFYAIQQCVEKMFYFTVQEWINENQRKILLNESLCLGQAYYYVKKGETSFRFSGGCPFYHQGLPGVDYRTIASHIWPCLIGIARKNTV